MFVIRCILELVCYEDEDWMVITTRCFKEKRQSHALKKGLTRWNLQDRNMLAETEETGVGKFTDSTNKSPTRVLAWDTKQDEENMELRLELSLNGRFGANSTKTRTPAQTSALKMKEDEENGELNLGLSLNGKFGVNPRTSKASSLPQEITQDSTQVSNVLGMNNQDKGESSSQEEMIDFETFLGYIHKDLVNVAHAFFASEAAKKK